MALIFLQTLVLFICLLATSNEATLPHNAPGENFDKLPFCDPSNSGLKHKDARLILVSTLDGRISALNLDGEGEVAWTLDTGPGAMLSSSIHQLELTKNGHWARMIPSLNGGLYNFNGDSVEAIPVNADNLLQSDFRYSDGSVISGGKESRTYGVVANSGRLIYECSLEGCVNLTEGMGSKDDENNILVVRRQTQTVRAVEPQTGMERWNFSVGQHDVKFLNDHSPECHGTEKTSTQKASEDYQVKVVVPEGIVCIVSKMQPNEIIWKQKFHSPVVQAWKLHDGQMNPIDLFSNSLMSNLNLDDLVSQNMDPPKLYIGMYKKQLYIQESIQMQSLIKKHQYLHISSGASHIPRIPWRPIPASKGWLDMIKSEESEENTALQPVDNSAHSTTALSVLYASEYINGNGFYLYSEKEEKTPSKNCANAEDSNDNFHNTSYLDNFTFVDDEDEMPVQIIHLTSLWVWWKEVLAISIASALFINVLFTQRFMRKMRFRMAQQMGYRTDRGMVEPLLPLFNETDSGIHGHLTKRSYSESEKEEGGAGNGNKEFVSRYLTDFEPVHRLGKGGFGVVFEARNKIDDCTYAIKRIPLPNKPESRERVLREVKALAKLDHQNIVRYFNSWLEFPPPGWQEEQDKAWIGNDALSESHFSFTTGDATSITLSDSTNEHHNIAVPNPPPMKPLTYIPNGIVGNLGADASAWLNLSNHESTATQSVTFGGDSSYNTQTGDFEKSDSFIVFADGSAHTSNAEDKEGIEKSPKENLFSSEEEKELPHESTHVPNFTRAIVVKKSEPILCSKGEESFAKKFAKKEFKKAVSLDSATRKGKQKYEKKDSSSFPSNRVYLYIQMQLCRRESLREWLRDEKSLGAGRKESLHIFDQIVHAVEYVHLHGLIHRDLKPSNIFFSHEGQVKVGDFGLVTTMAETLANEQLGDEDSANFLGNHRHTAQVGTQLYMSPEQLMGKPYNYKVDIYSLGLILFELLVPFNTQMERWRTLKDLRDNKFPPNFQKEHAEEFQLLKIMLSKNPDDRPTTIGIRARPPLLGLQDSSINDFSESFHYQLPIKRHSSGTS